MIEEIVDATEPIHSTRFGYVCVDDRWDGPSGRPGAVPRLRRGPRHTCSADRAREQPWLADAEDTRDELVMANRLPEYLDEVQPRTAVLGRTASRFAPG